MNSDTPRMLFASAAPKSCNAQFSFGGGSGSFRLVEAAAGGDSPSLPTIQMNAYNGGAMDVGWGLPVVVDMKGLDVKGFSRPLLKDHDMGQIVGHTTKVAKGASALDVEGVVSGSGDAAREVVANAKNGFPWQASVGVVSLNHEYVKEGSTAKANGQEFTGPIYIVRKGVLVEVSVVALGADSTTSTSIAARANQPTGETDMKFNEWLKAKGFDPDTLSEVQRTTLQASFDAEQASQPAQPVQAGAGSDAVVADIRAKAAAETKRIAAINAACGEKHADIQAKAIAEGWTSEKTELEVLRAERAKAPSAPAGHVRGGMDAGLRGKAIAAALCLSAGVSEKALAADKQNTEQVLEAATSRDLRGIGLQALLHETIAAAGGMPRYGRVDAEYIRAAYEASRKLQASGFAAISLTNVLGAVANKVALSAFESIETVATQFCHQYDASDFKTFTMVRLVENGTFQKVGPTGELKQGTLSEDAYTNKVETRGQLLTLTRQDWINDDLGLFNQLMAMLGRNAKLALESEAFAALMANASSFFGTGNKNYISGSDTVLSIAAFSAAEQKMLDMVDTSGKPIMASPKFLVVPTSLKVTAELLMKERMINETTTTDKGKPAANPHAGKCTVLASPYINSSAITGNSSTAWFLFADPNMVPCLQLAFLRGQRTPTIETGETDFDTLGMSWRGYFDFAPKLIDPRGGVMSKGAA